MKAVCLFSGGLDSQLAAALVKNQGVTVIGVNFSSPFFGANRATHLAAKALGIQLFVLDTGQEYIEEVLKTPVYGYGKNLNPCIDCHGFMLRKAGEFMQKLEASFLISGEVLGQRPMSQNRSALNAVDKLSGFRSLILRPLSARLLPATIPEIEGWVDREQLMDISGRGRTRQIELAEKLGIFDYPTPAGGCLLTEANFSRRLKKMLEVKPELEPGEMEILKLGRHFYLGERTLLAVGRNHSENESIQKISRGDDYLFKVLDRPGPLGLLRGFAGLKADEINQAAAIVARYSDARKENTAQVKFFKPGSEAFETISVTPLPPADVPASI
ncbi:MAG: tRNA 4-thiouridine(8) synthase ThiI [Syntrophomonas sp.]|uniref:tRNA 4-thiouridine(8) synthase ThiI n=1 Tax=Syntrophomonas sp. TaxID=2053627 RepID=UPI0026183D41|nr:tRNA 4-thiouridine(8) synthase ThiI [Syntrophomonas sp.]MDD2509781.1 tRNA 4-thiouridine(8) synthase ThiI [Syntrophomonas sp.]MDD3878889.1 tRNA 4-thiouridine(8) synthase ThiI [Syntrophomonas sp.]MDD4625726.1 tRNA 4-thiouridine(8) synthase ThiI [Syntrophomonas sp.]